MPASPKTKLCIWESAQSGPINRAGFADSRQTRALTPTPACSAMAASHQHVTVMACGAPPRDEGGTEAAPTWRRAAPPPLPTASPAAISKRTCWKQVFRAGIRQRHGFVQVFTAHTLKHDFTKQITAKTKFPNHEMRNAHMILPDSYD